MKKVSAEAAGLTFPVKKSFWNYGNGAANVKNAANIKKDALNPDGAPKNKNSIKKKPFASGKSRAIGGSVNPINSIKKKPFTFGKSRPIGGSVNPINSTKKKPFTFNRPAAVLTALIAVVLALNPRVYTAAVSEGFKLFTLSVLPSLFPFLVLSKTFLSVGGFDGAKNGVGKIFQKLYGVPPVGGGIFLTALISGYPVGAKMTADMYKNGSLTKDEAKTAAAFSSVAGPLFILGFVGNLTGVRGALIILVCHWLSAFFAGLFFRTDKKDKKPPDIKNGKIQKSKTGNENDEKKTVNQKQETLAETVMSAMSVVLLVGGFVALFNMLSEMFADSPLFSLLSFAAARLTGNESAAGAFLGLIEMTRGIAETAASGLRADSALPIICFLVSFGGLSVTFQNLAFLKSVGITPLGYVKMKSVQALFAAAFSSTAAAVLTLLRVNF